MLRNDTSVKLLYGREQRNMIVRIDVYREVVAMTYSSIIVIDYDGYRVEWLWNEIPQEEQSLIGQALTRQFMKEAGFQEE
jgi:hypothetical protein